VLPQLPLKIDEESIAIGEHRVAGKGAGCLMVHPNPLSPNRYALIWKGTVSRKGGHLWYAPDYVLFTEDTGIVMGGDFDGHWQPGAAKP
jgi:hypothetical protein